MAHKDFLLNTPILMVDGTTKLASEIIVGDVISTLNIEGMIDSSDANWKEWTSENPLNITIVTSTVKNIYSGTFENITIYSINNIEFGEDAVLFIYRNNLWQWLDIKDIQIGDLYLDKDQNEVEITEFSSRIENTEIITIDVENTDTLIAANILVHNGPVGLDTYGIIYKNYLTGGATLLQDTTSFDPGSDPYYWVVDYSPSDFGYSGSTWYRSSGSSVSAGAVISITKAESPLNLYYSLGSAPSSNYTITFDENGGTTVNDITVVSGTIVNQPTNPTRTGYTFSGWCYSETDDNGSGPLVTWPITVTANETLYAQWTPNSFVITLDANDGTTASNSAISVTYATSIEPFSSSMIPTRNGYRFNGYYTAASGGTQKISSLGYIGLTSSTYLSATTLYAQWTAYVTLNSISPTIVNSAANQNITINVTEAPNLISQPGYSMTLYSAETGGTGTQVAYGDTEVTSGSTISCNFSGITSGNYYIELNYNGYTAVPRKAITVQQIYNITWNPAGGTWSDSSTSNKITTVNPNVVPTAPSLVTRTGYAFNAWSPTIVAATQDTTYTATWTANTYTVTFDPNGGETPSPTSKTVTYASTYGTLATVSRPGYDFDGWYTTAVSGGSLITSSTTVSITSNQTLYARWTEILGYTITLNSVSPTSFLTGGNRSFSLYFSIIGSGLYFPGYDVSLYDSSTGGNLVTGLVFNPGDISSGDTITGDFSGVIPGTYYLNFYYKEVNATPRKQITVTGVIISFDSNGGSEISDIIVNSGTSINQPTNPTRTGYIFDGWYYSETDDNGSGTAVSWPISPTANDTLYAKWTPITYTVRYNPNGADSGSIINETGKIYDVSFNLTSTGYAKTGYQFLGWNTNSSATFAIYSDGQSVSNLTTINGAIVTLYAIWEFRESGRIIVGSKEYYNYDYPSDETYWNRGFRETNTSTKKIVGGFNANAMTINDLREDATFRDVSASSLPIYVGTTTSYQIKIINPNHIIKSGTLRYTISNSNSGSTNYNRVYFNSQTIRALKNNANNSSDQKAIIILQGAGGSGGSGSSSFFATRDAAGGGSGAAAWIITELYNNASSYISIGGYGEGPTTTSTNGRPGGYAQLVTYSISTGSQQFTAGGGSGGTSDSPNPPVGGAAGSFSSVNPASNVLYSTSGRSGGGTGDGGSFSTGLDASSISGSFFGNYILTGSLTNNFGYISFPGLYGASTSKSGGERTDGCGGQGGAGGGASRFWNGGDGANNTGTDPNDSNAKGQLGSGGGGGDSGTCGKYQGSDGGYGFAAIIF